MEMGGKWADGFFAFFHNEHEFTMNISETVFGINQKVS